MQNRRDFIKTAIAASIMPTLCPSNTPTIKCYKNIPAHLRVNTIRFDAKIANNPYLGFNNFYVNVTNDIATFFILKAAVSETPATKMYTESIQLLDCGGMLCRFNAQIPFFLYYWYRDAHVNHLGSILKFNFGANYKILNEHPIVAQPAAKSCQPCHWYMYLKLQCNIDNITVTNNYYTWSQITSAHSSNRKCKDIDFRTSLNTYFEEVPNFDPKCFPKERYQWLR
jgi:hypothetical protein